MNYFLLWLISGLVTALIIRYKGGKMPITYYIASLILGPITIPYVLLSELFERLKKYEI